MFIQLPDEFQKKDRVNANFIIVYGPWNDDCTKVEVICQGGSYVTPCSVDVDKVLKEIDERIDNAASR